MRLCDGFYWPISFSTTRSRFKKDAKACEESCPAKARLFVLESGSDDVASMVDLQGQLYAELENAFRNRKEYVSTCTCRAHPWEPEALARHKAYAEAEAAVQSAKSQAGNGISEQNRAILTGQPARHSANPELATGQRAR